MDDLDFNRGIFIVSVVPANASGVAIDAISLAYNESGIRLLCTSNLISENSVSVILSIPSKAFSVTLSGEMVSSKPYEGQKGYFDTLIRFSYMTADDKELLDKFTALVAEVKLEISELLKNEEMRKKFKAINTTVSVGGKRDKKKDNMIFILAITGCLVFIAAIFYLISYLFATIGADY